MSKLICMPSALTTLKARLADIIVQLIVAGEMGYRASAQASFEWAVQRRYLTLETLAPISDAAAISLPAVAV